VGNFLRTSIFFNPLIHVPNIWVHHLVERVSDNAMLPTRWRAEVRSAMKAIRAVATQNNDFLTALDEGAPMQSHREEIAKISDLFFNQLAGGLEAKEPWAERIAKSIGMSPVNLIKAIYNLSGKVTWTVNDTAFLQAAYAKTERGVPLKDALREVSKHIPDYRLPTRILETRTLAKLMSNPNLTMFGAYHYGALKSYGEAIKSALGVNESNVGRGTAKEALHGWQTLAVIGLATFVMYPLLDELAQKASGQGNARLRRAGAATFPYNIAKLIEHEKTPFEVLESVATPAVHTKTAIETATNRDWWTGRNIYDPHADWETIGQQIGRHLAEAISPVQQATRIAEGPEGSLKRFAWGMAGVRFPRSAAEQEALQISSSKAGTAAWTPQERKEYYARQRAIEGLRKGDSGPLDKALKEGTIRPDQTFAIRRRARMTWLQDKVHGFTWPEIERVYEKAKAEKDVKAMTELLPMMREKRQNYMERRQYYLEHGQSEVPQP